MNVLVEMFNGSDYISAAPHSAGLNVYDLESQQVRWADRQTDRRSDTRVCSAQLWLPGSVPDGVDAERSLEVMGLKFHLRTLSIQGQLCVLELRAVVSKGVKFKDSLEC